MIPNTFNNFCLNDNEDPISFDLGIGMETNYFNNQVEDSSFMNFNMEASLSTPLNFDQEDNSNLFLFNDNNKEIEYDLDLNSVHISCLVCKNQVCTCFSDYHQPSEVSEKSGSENNLTEKHAYDTKLIIPKPNFRYEFPVRKTSQIDTIENKLNCEYLSTKNIDSTMRDTEEEQQKADAKATGNSVSSKSKAESNLFLVRRACFRGFSEYYKNKFAAANYSWQRKRGNKKKKTPMMELIRDFAEEEFGSLVTNLTESQWEIFRTTLFTVMFSHRYKKNDEFLAGIDFTEIRNVLYHYTTEARTEFLKNTQF